MNAFIMLLSIQASSADRAQIISLARFRSVISDWVQTKRSALPSPSLVMTFPRSRTHL